MRLRSLKMKLQAFPPLSSVSFGIIPFAVIYALLEGVVCLRKDFEFGLEGRRSLRAFLIQIGIIQPF